MITAEKLQTLITFTPKALGVALANSGYRGCEFDTAKFLGMTNANQFCYSVTYYDDNTEAVETAKVFLTYDPVLGSARAEF